MKQDKFARFKTTFSVLALAGLMMLQYQNCSSYNDPSPFEVGDVTGASTSSPTQAKLDSPVGVLDLNQYDLAISVGGECNVGLSEKHYIEIKLLDIANQDVPVREDSTCPKEGASLDIECYRATQFKCEHGRYSLHLPINCSAYRNATQSTYRLKGQMVTFDKAGKEIRDTKAAFDRFFQIAWAPGACP
jgi:hypothetical protein